MPPIVPPLKARPESIPSALKELHQWVVWRYEEREGTAKPTKVPYMTTGRKASSTDPTTWSDFEPCLSAAARFDGVGIVCANGIAGIDLDSHVNENGIVTPFAQEIIKGMQSYTEISPSGKGLKILCYGKLPTGRRRNDALGIEMYDSDRYFTVTGLHLPNTPRKIEHRTAELVQLHLRIFGEPKDKVLVATHLSAVPQNDQELLAKIFASKNGAKIKSLWSGDTRAYNHNDSCADLALCDQLAFWTQGDAARMDTLFRSSGLMRPKWDERHSADGRTYGQMTIEKAITGMTSITLPMPNSRPDREFQSLQNNGNGNSHEVGDPSSFSSATPRYVLHHAREALELQPPMEWIVESLFSVGSVSLVVGEGGSKKTWTLLDAAVAVAQGEQWLEFPTQQAPVLLIDEESGLRRLNLRLGDVMRGHNASSDLPIAYTCLAQWNLANASDVSEIERLIRTTGVRFVVIDALADVMLGADENSVKEVQPIFSNLRRIADATRCAIVIIHHANKLGTYRGSTAIHGAIDLMLTVESRMDSDLVKFKMEKVRDVAPRSFAARINFAPGIVNLSPATVQKEAKKRSPSQRYVLNYLSEHGDSEMEIIMSNADICSAEGARKAVYELAKEEIIRRVDAGGQGKKATYGIIGPESLKRP